MFSGPCDRLKDIKGGARMRRTLIATAASAAALLTMFTAPAANADTESCATLAEYDRTSYGETPLQVATRFDVYGQFLSDTDNRFRRGYRSCWAPGIRRIVVAYSYDDNGAVNWFVTDVD